MITAIYWMLLLICVGALVYLITIIHYYHSDSYKFREESRQHAHEQWKLKQEAERWM
jgi:hypothetical protein